MKTLLVALLALAVAGCAAGPQAADEPVHITRGGALAPERLPPWARRAETLRLPERPLAALPRGTALEIDVFGEARLAARVQRNTRAGASRGITAPLEAPHAGALVLTFTPLAPGDTLVAGSLEWDSAGRRFVIFSEVGMLVLAEVAPDAERELPGAPPLIPDP